MRWEGFSLPICSLTAAYSCSSEGSEESPPHARRSGEALMLKCKGPWVRTMCVLLFCGSFSAAVLAQSYTLSGKVIDSASHTVPSATVSAKSVTTGQTFTAQTGADGTYSIANLAAGD